LKRVFAQFLDWFLPLFPPSKNGGPIEADTSETARAEATIVSAVKKRRPH